MNWLATLGAVALLSGNSVAYAGPSPLTGAASGVYTYPGPGTVNTYWIDTPGGGLVVIDVQRDLKHAQEALDAVKQTGRPVRAILVTHGHPDHYTGLGLFKAAFPQATIWSSRTTYETIRTDSYGFNALVQQFYGADAPKTFTLPDRAFAGDAVLNIDGLEIVVRELGAAEANDASVYYVPSTGDLYVGDLVLNHLHALFGEAKTAEWLAALDRLEVLFPSARTLHPGHGVSGTPSELLADERDYIRRNRRLAALELAEHGQTADGEKRVADQIRAQFPYENPAGLRDIVGISVRGLFEELSKPGQVPAK